MQQETKTQPARPRDLMPQVWQRIGELRKEWGDAHVTDCIKRGIAGEPDRFYAFEAGHVVGTPFLADRKLADYIHLAVSLGGRYALVMRPPEAAKT